MAITLFEMFQHFSYRWAGPPRIDIIPDGCYMAGGGLGSFMEDAYTRYLPAKLLGAFVKIHIQP